MSRLHGAKAVIFDFYGTLACDAVSVPPMWQYLNSLGYSSHSELEAMFEPDGFDGTSTASVDGGEGHDVWIRGNWRRFVQLSGVPQDDVESILNQLMDLRATYRARAVPGARELLDQLRRCGVLIGLCSNWENDITPYLHQAKLPPFDAMAMSMEVGARKPNPLIFTTICSRLKTRPADTVFVGDNWFADVVGALRSGLTPVWIRHGKPSRGLTRHVAEFDSLAELADFLQPTFSGDPRV